MSPGNTSGTPETPNARRTSSGEVVAKELNREYLGEVDRSEVTATIRAAVSREHEVSLSDLVLLRPVQLQKTSSGKIMRSAAKSRFLNGELGGTY